MKHETLQIKSEYGRTQSENYHRCKFLPLLIDHGVGAVIATIKGTKWEMWF